MLVGIDAISGYRQLGSVTWALVPGDWYLEPGTKATGSSFQCPEPGFLHYPTKNLSFTLL
jgi:hypothetical protein